MRLYVLDLGKKVYIAFNKPIQHREDIPVYFQVNNKTFSQNNVIPEKNMSAVVVLAIIFGLMFGALFGVSIMILAAMIGAAIGYNEDRKDDKLINNFDTYDYN